MQTRGSVFTDAETIAERGVRAAWLHSALLLPALSQEHSNRAARSPLHTQSLLRITRCSRHLLRTVRMPRPSSPASDHSVFENTQTRQEVTPYRAPHHPAAYHSFLYHAEHYQHLEHTQRKALDVQSASSYCCPCDSHGITDSTSTPEQRTTTSIHPVKVGQRVSNSQQAGLPGLSWNC